MYPKRFNNLELEPELFASRLRQLMLLLFISSYRLFGGHLKITPFLSVITEINLFAAYFSSRNWNWKFTS